MGALLGFPNGRFFASLVVALFLLFSLFSLYPTSSEYPSLSHPQIKPQTDRCEPFSNANIQVIVKTGANVIYDKLPLQLLTALRCPPQPLIFSDLQQEFGPLHVHDVLEHVNETIKASSPEFEYYRTLQEYQKYGQDVRSLRDSSKSVAWRLDKYKFIHMLVKAWTLRPNRDWYVFVEADTYLIWSNLVMWLDRRDPSQPQYLGSPTYLNGEAFAHGGSGIILSRAAMEKVLSDDEDITERYDVRLQKEYYGDYVLMKALEEKGIALEKSWPMMQGKKQNSLPFGPGPGNGVRHWCQPLVTMHGVTPEDVNAIWQLEQQRPDVKKPLLMAEIYEHFMGRNLPAELDDWYNLSDDLMFRAPGVEGSRQKSAEDMTDVEKEAHQSFEKCGMACEEHPKCFQTEGIAS
ncbi:hypothetical protein MW887_010808 [Aspergillus wentii]|nr:hypothetical protein MW887_010808 [Aspergillus wentii]